MEATKDNNNKNNKRYKIRKQFILKHLKCRKDEKFNGWMDQNRMDEGDLARQLGNFPIYHPFPLIPHKST